MKTLLLLIASISLFSQGVTTIPGGVGKASNNVILRGSGNTLPSLCTVGQQFFKSNATAGQNIYGCTAANTWTLQGSPTGSGSTLLQQVSASSSSSLDFTGCISSSYDAYAISVVNLIPSVDGAKIGLRMSTNGGSSYDSGSNYRWSAYAMGYVGVGVNGSASDTAMYFSNESNNDTADYGLSGDYSFYGPMSTSLKKAVSGLGFGPTAVATPLSWVFFGNYSSTSAVNAFQVMVSSGNILSGTVRCYGLAK